MTKITLRQNAEVNSLTIEAPGCDTHVYDLAPLNRSQRATIAGMVRDTLFPRAPDVLRASARATSTLKVQA